MRTAALAAIPLMAAACQSPPASTPAGTQPAAPEPEPRPAISARFDCGGMILPVVFRDDRVVLTLADRDLILPQAVSASGARYSDGTSELWNKGNDATLTLDGTRTECRGLPDPWEDAKARGVDFRAVGQEPGWFLEIETAGEMRLSYDYGERKAAVPTPTPVVAGGTTTYASASGGLTVIVTSDRCGDAMSAEPFPHTVYVTVDGRELRGCGREVPR